jgi:hypothetical protein
VGSGDLFHYFLTLFSRRALAAWSGTKGLCFLIRFPYKFVSILAFPLTAFIVASESSVADIYEAKLLLTATLFLLWSLLFQSGLTTVALDGFICFEASIAVDSSVVSTACKLVITLLAKLCRLVGTHRDRSYFASEH